VEDGALSLNGGGTGAAADDLAFFALAGHIEGQPIPLKVGDFWTFGPVNRAIAKLGTQ
jgi:NitT/TauT family transport system substrate-binding protein